MKHRKPHYKNYWKIYQMNYLQLLVMELGFLFVKIRKVLSTSTLENYRRRQYAMTAYWYSAHWLGQR